MITFLLLSIIINTIFLFIFFTFVNKTRKDKKKIEQIIKLNQESKEVFNNSFNDLQKIFNEKNQIILILYTSNLITYLIINLLVDNKERYSFYYQKLFFLGVPKNILEDLNKLNLFLDDLSKSKYFIEKGKSPYEYNFVLKEEKK